MTLSDAAGMSISVSERDGQATIALAGRFTFSAHAAFRDVLNGKVAQVAPGGAVAFDLRGVEFVDSAALGMLLLAREAAEKRSGRVILRGATGQVQRMLAVSRFETLFSIEP